MRFILLLAASPEAEPLSGPPDTEAIRKLFAYNEDLHKAGVLVTSEGLNPAGRSAHVRFRKGHKPKIVDGPFAETKELIGGFYLIDVKSLEEAAEWASRYPGGYGGDDVIEIRPMTNGEDIPPEIMALCREAAPTWTASLADRDH